MTSDSAASAPRVPHADTNKSLYWICVKLKWDCGRGKKALRTTTDRLLDFSLINMFVVPINYKDQITDSRLLTENTTTRQEDRLSITPDIRHLLDFQSNYLLTCFTVTLKDTMKDLISLLHRLLVCLMINPVLSATENTEEYISFSKVSVWTWRRPYMSVKATDSSYRLGGCRISAVPETIYHFNA